LISIPWASGYYICISETGATIHFLFSFLFPFQDGITIKNETVMKLKNKKIFEEDIFIQKDEWFFEIDE